MIETTRMWSLAELLGTKKKKKKRIPKGQSVSQELQTTLNNEMGELEKTLKGIVSNEVLTDFFKVKKTPYVSGWETVVEGNIYRTTGIAPYYSIPPSTLFVGKYYETIKKKFNVFEDPESVPTTQDPMVVDIKDIAKTTHFSVSFSCSYNGWVKSNKFLITFRLNAKELEFVTSVLSKGNREPIIQNIFSDFWVTRTIDPIYDMSYKVEKIDKSGTIKLFDGSLFFIPDDPSNFDRRAEFLKIYQDKGTPPKTFPILLDIKREALIQTDTTGAITTFSLSGSMPVVDEDLKKLLENTLNDGVTSGTGSSIFRIWDARRHLDTKQLDFIAQNSDVPMNTLQDKGQLLPFLREVKKVYEDRKDGVLRSNYLRVMGYVQALIQNAKRYRTIAKNVEVKRRAFNSATGKDVPPVPNMGTHFVFLPHQAEIIAKLDKAKETAVLDVGTGGGKTPTVLIDAVALIQKGEIKRPLIVMPKKLIGQWIGEVDFFSGGQINPIAITTETVKSWGEEKMTKMCKSAPPNTIFLTSYSYLTLDKRINPFAKKVKSYIFPKVEWIKELIAPDFVCLDECFLGDTYVLIDYDKAVTMEEIYNNPKITHILSYDLKSKQIVKKKIKKKLRYDITKKDKFAAVNIHDKKREIEASQYMTPKHGFFLKDGTEKPADELDSGDELITYNGKFTACKSCEYCGELVPCGQAYKSHLMSAHKEETGLGVKVKCPHCSKVCTRGSLYKHIMFKHNPTSEAAQAVRKQKSEDHLDFYKTKKGKEVKQAASQRMLKNNPMRQKEVREKAGIGVSKAFWSKSAKERNKQVKRFMQAPLHSNNKMNKVETRVNDVGIKGLIYTGNGGYWVTLNPKKLKRTEKSGFSKDKSYQKNPDFIYVPYKCGTCTHFQECKDILTIRVNSNPCSKYKPVKTFRSNKVVEVMDLEYWHNRDEACLVKKMYKRKGIDCLVLNSKTSTRRLRGKIESFINNHYVEVTDCKSRGGGAALATKGQKYKYDLNITGSHNYFVLFDRGIRVRGERVPGKDKLKNSIPILVHNSHFIKKPSSIRSQACMALRDAPYRRIATGTLITNNPPDLIGQIAFLDPSALGDKKAFNERYAAEYSEKTGKVYRWKSEDIEGVDAADMIREDLRNNTFYLMYREKDWAALLPEISYGYHFVDMTSIQKKIYGALVTEMMEEILGDPLLSKKWAEFSAGEEDLDSLNSPRLLGKMAKLEQFITAPDHFQSKSYEDKAGFVYTLDNPVDKISPKLKMIDELIGKSIAAGSKCIVGVHYKFCARHLAENSIYSSSAVYYDAGEDAAIERFKTDKDIKVLFAVLISITEGMNLQIADRIILADVDWTPGKYKQLVARIYRPYLDKKTGKNLNENKHVSVDVVLANNSADALKYCHQTRKKLYNSKVMEKSPIKPPPPLVLSEDNLHASMSAFGRAYLDSDKEYNGWLLSEVNEQKAKGNAKLIPVKHTPPIEGSRSVDVPWVSGMDTPLDVEGTSMTLWAKGKKINLLRLKQGSDASKEERSEIKKNFFDLVVKTQWGEGRVVGMSARTVTVKYPDGTKKRVKFNMAVVLEKTVLEGEKKKEKRKKKETEKKERDYRTKIGLVLYNNIPTLLASLKDTDNEDLKDLGFVYQGPYWILRVKNQKFGDEVLKRLQKKFTIKGLREIKRIIAQMKGTRIDIKTFEIPDTKIFFKRKHLLAKKGILKMYSVVKGDKVFLVIDKATNKGSFASYKFKDKLGYWYYFAKRKPDIKKTIKNIEKKLELEITNRKHLEKQAKDLKIVIG